MAEAAQTCVAMDDFNLFAYYDVSKHGEEGKDRWHSGFSVDDEKGNMIDFEAIGEVVNSRASMICMRHHNHFVTSINELLMEDQSA